MSLKEELLAAVEAAGAEKPKLVVIKGFPKFWVRGRTVGEVDTQKLNSDDWVKENTLTAAASLCICDENGKLLFDPEDPDDRELMKKFAKLPWTSVVQKIVEASTNDQELTKEGN